MIAKSSCGGFFLIEHVGPFEDLAGFFLYASSSVRSPAFLFSSSRISTRRSSASRRQVSRLASPQAEQPAPAIRRRARSRSLRS